MISIIKEWMKIPIHYFTLIIEFFLSPHKLLRNLEGKFDEETIYCVGGGPSLKEEDLSLLNGKKVILCNFAYKILEQCNPSFKISVSQDTRRITSLKDVNRGLFDISMRTLYGRPHMLLKFLLEKSFKKQDVLVVPKMYGFLRDTEWEKEDLLQNGLNHSIQPGSSVINFAIQLAYYLGAKKIVLLGVDMNYSFESSHFDENREYDKSIVSDNVLQQMVYQLRDLNNALREKNVELINTSPLTNEPYTKKMSLSEVVNLENSQSTN